MILIRPIPCQPQLLGAYEQEDVMKYRFRSGLLIVLIVLLVIAVASVLRLRTTGVGPISQVEFLEVLSWLAIETVPLAVAGAALSYFLEIVPGWGSDHLKGFRPFIVMLICIILGVQAQMFVQKLGILAQVQVCYKTLYDVAVVWVATQQTFGKIKKDGMSANR